MEKDVERRMETGARGGGEGTFDSCVGRLFVVGSSIGRGLM